MDIYATNLAPIIQNNIQAFVNECDAQMLHHFGPGTRPIYSVLVNSYRGFICCDVFEIVTKRKCQAERANLVIGNDTHEASTLLSNQVVAMLGNCNPPVIPEFILCDFGVDFDDNGVEKILAIRRLIAGIVRNLRKFTGYAAVDFDFALLHFEALDPVYDVHVLADEEFVDRNLPLILKAERSSTLRKLFPAVTTFTAPTFGQVNRQRIVGLLQAAYGNTPAAHSTVHIYETALEVADALLSHQWDEELCVKMENLAEFFRSTLKFWDTLNNDSNIFKIQLSLDRYVDFFRRHRNPLTHQCMHFEAFNFAWCYEVQKLTALDRLTLGTDFRNRRLEIFEGSIDGQIWHQHDGPRSWEVLPVMTRATYNALAPLIQQQLLQLFRSRK